MAIFTFEQALKKTGARPEDVKSLGMVLPTEQLEKQKISKISPILPTNPEVVKEGEKFAKTFSEAPGIMGKTAAVLTLPLRAAGTTARIFGKSIAEPLMKFAEFIGSPIVEQIEKKVPGFSEEVATNVGSIAQVVQNKANEIKNAVGEESYNALVDAADAISTFYGGRAVAKPLEKAAQETLEASGRAVGSGVDVVTGAVKTGAEAVAGATEKAKTTLFGRPSQVTSIDDVVKQADEALKPSQILTATEKMTAKPSLLQRWAGISPDIKNRIAGKYQKLKEYFDVAHARNNYDTLPTPLEHGAKNVDNAVTKMEGVLNDTGSKIGQFRQKVGTYKATPDAVKTIEGSFDNQLSKLNLEVKNGVVKQKPGTVRRVNSDSEVKVLNDLYKDFQTVKQSPDLERLIDLRTLFDSKINFAKSARDVSSSLDPLSRAVRKQIADTAATIVGKSEATNLTKYAEFIDAYNQLRSFTDRRAGAEFLLKQVLSERGGTPREIMQTIKEFTDIDLMDDAVMSQIATDLIGNARQKGVFRQELTKAGLDTEAILRGDTRGAIELMSKVLKKTLVNEEKQYLKAAR